MGDEAAPSPFGGKTQVSTSDGRTVWVKVAGDSLCVVDSAGAELAVPYPAAGYGGHELLLSPNETYLAMWLYSGQSEVGYELFQFTPALRHLLSLPYVYGGGGGPSFSPDEQRIALAWSTNSNLDVDEQKLDEHGGTLEECVVDWATVHVQELPSGPSQECRIDVRLAAGFASGGDDDYYPSNLSMPTARSVRFDTEWGTTLTLDLPLPGSVVTGGPKKRRQPG